MTSSIHDPTPLRTTPNERHSDGGDSWVDQVTGPPPPARISGRSSLGAPLLSSPASLPDGGSLAAALSLAHPPRLLRVAGGRGGETIVVVHFVLGRAPAGGGARPTVGRAICPPSLGWVSHPIVRGRAGPPTCFARGPPRGGGAGCRGLRSRFGLRVTGAPLRTLVSLP